MLAGPRPSGSAGLSRRCRGCLPPLAGVSRFRLPPASLCCCDSTTAQVFHLRSVAQRLVAHQVAFPMAWNSTILDLGGTLADHHHRVDKPARAKLRRAAPVSGVPVRHAQFAHRPRHAPRPLAASSPARAVADTRPLHGCPNRCDDNPACRAHPYAVFRSTSSRRATSATLPTSSINARKRTFNDVVVSEKDTVVATSRNSGCCDHR